MKYVKILLIISLLSCCFHGYSLTNTDSVYIDLYNFLKKQNEIPKEYQKKCLKDIKFIIDIQEVCSDTLTIDLSTPFAVYEFSYKGSSGSERYFLLKYKNEMTVYNQNNVNGITRNLLAINQKDSVTLNDNLLVKYLDKIVDKEKLLLTTKIGKIWYVDK